MYSEKYRETDTSRETYRQRNRETYIQGDIPISRKTDTQKVRHECRDTYRQAERHTERQTNRGKYIQGDIHTNKQDCKGAERRSRRETSSEGRQTNRDVQTGRHRNIKTDRQVDA